MKAAEQREAKGTYPDNLRPLSGEKEGKGRKGRSYGALRPGISNDQQLCESKEMSPKTLYHKREQKIETNASLGC